MKMFVMSRCVITILFLLFTQKSALASSNPELRCGWFENFSAGNASLIDKDGEWTISMQGQYEAKGIWPQFKEKEWVNSGISGYGYGCVCLRVTTRTDAQEIIEIIKSIPKPLSDCRQDKNLKAP